MEDLKIEFTNEPGYIWPALIHSGDEIIGAADKNHASLFAAAPDLLKAAEDALETFKSMAVILDRPKLEEGSAGWALEQAITKAKALMPTTPASREGG
jgi:hypothetical protein